MILVRLTYPGEPASLRVPCRRRQAVSDSSDGGPPKRADRPAQCAAGALVGSPSILLPCKKARGLHGAQTGRRCFDHAAQRHPNPKPYRPLPGEALLVVPGHLKHTRILSPPTDDLVRSVPALRNCVTRSGPVSPPGGGFPTLLSVVRRGGRTALRRRRQQAPGSDRHQFLLELLVAKIYPDTRPGRNARAAKDCDLDSRQPGQTALPAPFSTRPPQLPRRMSLLPVDVSR